MILSQAGSHVILGRRLGVLCADYLELLEAAGVGLVEGDIPSPRDLLDCVAILSQPPEKAAHDLEQGKLWRCFGNESFWLWRWFTRWCWTRRITRLFQEGREYERAIIQLAAWLQDNWKPPKIRWRSLKEKEAVSPYTDHLRLMLCERGLVRDMQEAGRYPLSNAAWEAEAIHEQETGESRLESDKDRRIDAAIEESIRLAEEERKEVKHG